jgi:hypothetical protein
MRDRRRALPKPIGSLETLDDRLMLSGAGVGHVVPTSAVIHMATSTPKPTNSSEIQNGPLAKAGQQLTALYDEFEQKGTVDPTLSRVFQISGTSVAISIVSTTEQYSSLVSELKTLGIQIESSSSTYNTVSGFVPISQLLTVSELPQTLSMSPISRPRLTL